MNLNKKFDQALSRLGQWASCKPLWWFAMASIILHILRQPQAFLHPQFWAEDGKVFFQGDFYFGPEAFLKTYAGYLHLWPRLWAFLFGYLPLLWLPYAYKLFSLFTHALLLLILASKRFPGSHLQKAMMMLIIPLVPHDGEAYLNLANTISFCCLITAAMVILSAPKSWIVKIFETLAFAVLGATGPYFIFILPVAAVYWHLQKNRFGYLHRLIGYSAGVALQLAYFSIAERPENLDTHPAFSVWAKAIRVAFKCLEFGKVPFPKFIEWMMAIGTLAALLVCFWPRIKELFRLKFSPSIFLAGIATANLMASMWVGRVHLNNLGPFTGASRYYLVTYILVLWALTLDWDNEHPRLKRGMIACSIFFSLLNFSSMMPSRGVDWAGQVKELNETGRLRMQALPLREEWQFLIEKDKAWRRAD